MLESHLWVVALVAGSGGFALPALAVLVHFRNRSPGLWVGPSLVLASGLYLVWTVNLATLLLGGGWSSLHWFTAMNLGFLGSAGAGFGALAVALSLTGGHKRALWFGVGVAAALGLWLVGLYRALLSQDGLNPAVFHYGEVFTFGTLAAAIFLVLSGVVLACGRRALPPEVRRLLAVFSLLLLFVAGWAVADDVGDLDQHWWGVDLPSSPWFLVLSAWAVYLTAWNSVRRASAESEPEWDSWLRAQQISARETEILLLLLEGVDRVDLAARLFISPITVKNHLAALYRKSSTSDLTELLTLARSIRDRSRV